MGEDKSTRYNTLLYVTKNKNITKSNYFDDKKTKTNAGNIFPEPSMVAQCGVEVQFHL